ncbi:hypothetical protein LCGC14_1036720 [marine sediment metagenome]|uniref:Uncharacterized protein n=1 Tax=marine sediment metagenome TaxID=412755 RepID=A0A0F9QZ40_9ZZZZ
MGLTKSGLGEMANLGTDDSSPEYWAYLAIGTGTTAFANTQTALVSQSGSRVAATVTRITTTHSNDTMRFTATFDISSSITITEVAIFNASTGGEMLARTVLGTSHAVTSGQVYALIYDIPIAAA